MNTTPMNPRQEPASGSLQQGMFFRAADRTLCDYYCGKIISDAKSLAIVAASEAIADHYCSLIIQCLRAIPDVRLQLHQASTTERLLDNFNEILSSLSTTEAMRGRNPSAPLRILVAGPADLLNPQANRLLTRLITSFPGANTQVIVLQAGRGAEHSLDIPSSHLVRWVVAEPSRAEATAMLANARAAGMEAEVIDLLDRVAPALCADAPEPQVLRDAEDSVYEPAPAAAAGTRPLEVPKLPANKGRGRAKRFAGFKGVVLVAISLLVVAPFFPRQIMALRDALSSWGQGVASAVSQAQRASSQSAAHSEGTRSPATPPQDSALVSKPEVPRAAAENTDPDRASAAAAGPLSAPLPAAAGTEAGGLPAQPAQAHSTTAVTAPKETRQNIDTERASAGAPSTGANSQTLAVVPGIATMQTAMTRVRAARENSIFVQHVAMDTYAAARDWQRAHQGLVEALIVPVKPGVDTAIKYVVVSGPFGSAASATEFSKKAGVPPAPWLRTAASLNNTLAVTDPPNPRGAR